MANLSNNSPQRLRSGQIIAHIVSQGMHVTQVPADPAGATDTCLLMLSVEQTTVETYRNSKINKDTAAATWLAIEGLLAQGYQESDIVIATLYPGQASIHKTIAWRRACAEGRASHDMVIETAERAPIRNVAVFDIANTAEIDLVANKSRLGSAYSRGLSGLIIVLNDHSTQHLNGNKTTEIEQCIDYFRTQRSFFVTSKVPGDNQVFAQIPNMGANSGHRSQARAKQGPAAPARVPNQDADYFRTSPVVDLESTESQRNAQAATRREEIMRCYQAVVRDEKQLDPAAKSMTEDLVSCRRLDQLPRLNFLRFTKTEMAALKSSLDSDQQRVLSNLKNMQGGYGVINGKVATGKTYLVVQVLAHKARKQRRVANQTANGCRFLVTSPHNNKVKYLLDALVDAFEALGISDAVFIRRYGEPVNSALVEEWDEKELDLEENMGTVGEVADEVFREFARHKVNQDHVFLDGKRASLCHGLSMSQWIFLALAGPAQNEKLAVRRVRNALPTELIHDLRNALAEFRSIDHTGHRHLTIRDAFKEAIKHVYNVADVVACSKMAVDESLKTAGFRPTTFVHDDAQDAHPVDNTAWVLFPGCKYRITICGIRKGPALHLDTGL